ncbi:hypothetical protein [Massilia genomosp. 1]|uniref:Uncharacterized protein n=1 Tax=Massilia genomosp. 1 TaxID=2609280 RepID=A0ABX0MUF7_9BURK|nr:hypothetical protein [Massilia genomosp. 1]NHZ63097.1 hypothetical protein [Massilia genomosp. 1]
MSDSSTSLARLAMRLRAVTERPPQLCKQFLEELPEAHRVAYVAYMESNSHSFFVDPVELDPAVYAALAKLRRGSGSTERARAIRQRHG